MCVLKFFRLSCQNKDYDFFMTTTKIILCSRGVSRPKSWCRGLHRWCSNVCWD